MSERIKIFLDSEGEITFRIDKEKYKLSRIDAFDLKYKIYRVIGLQSQYDAINSWRPEYVSEEEIY